MYTGRSIFAQIMDVFPIRRFHTCVRRYRGDTKIRKFSCLDQFRVMSFAQLTYRESLRDIEACLKAMQPKLYHMGIGHCPARSTLAEANEKRDWRIFADICQVLISRARSLYADEDFGRELKDATLYALDSSTIDLCLTLFPWAHFRKTKAAVKLHTLMDLRGSIPVFIHISEAKLHDVNILDLLLPEPGAFYVMDRAYTDFTRLHQIHKASAYFVTRAKKNFKYKRRYSRLVDKTIGLRCDQTVVLTTYYPSKGYPEPVRRIAFVDQDTKKRLVFLTNNFQLPAQTIAALYKARWHIELFFKWIKQHLRIKSFYGTSPNAVKTQIWIAISTYLLVAILKKELGLSQSLYTILQILSISLFEKIPISSTFSMSDYNINMNHDCNHLSLFNF